MKTLNLGYLFISAIYFIAFLLGPQLLYSQKYFVTYGPLALLLITIYFGRDELKLFNWSLLKERLFLRWVYKGFQYMVFTQAIGTLILGPFTHSQAEQTTALYSIAILHMIISGPVVEEVVFRKVLYNKFKNISNELTGTVVSSMFYAVIHDNMERFPIYFITGCILCSVYKKSNTIATTILIHILINAVALIANFIRQKGFFY
ncbi:lysostaphin resistance A-like protein [Paenibacillus sp. S-38]|uniref:CPBP family intramembrane glutamic endopeptidase n=1 Tax=Paenibacillus sp. S-38 TaxID=3416710 RepID=UPI003CEBE513